MQTMPSTSQPDAALDEIDLVDLLVPLLRAWKLILVVVLAASLGGWAISALRAPSFEAEARLRVEAPSGFDVPGWSPPPAGAYAALVEDPAWFGDLAAATGLPYDALRDRLDVEVVEDAQAVIIRVRDDDAEEAARVANLAAEHLIRWSDQFNRAHLQRALQQRLRYLEDSIAARSEQLRRLEPVIWAQEAIAGEPEDVSTLTALLTRRGGAAAERLAAVRESGNLVLLRQIVNPVWEQSALALADEERQQELFGRLARRLADAPSGEVASLHVLVPASPPVRPAGPGQLLYGAVAGMLGFMLAVFFIYGRDFWRRQLVPALSR